jgi:tartrate-resistant acid phosphatase type 5
VTGIKKHWKWFLLLICFVAGSVGLLVYLRGLTPPAVELSNHYRDAERLSFFALGDQGTGKLPQWRVARSMEAVAEKAGDVNFVILLGDSFYGKDLQSISDKRWNYRFENMYSGRELDKLPFFAILGNHDRGKNADIELAYAREKIGSGRWQMPARYYSQDFGKHHGGPLLRVVFIDTTAIEPEAIRQQVEFVRHAFNATPAPVWRMVVGHHTIRSFGKHGKDTRLQSLVLPLLQENKVDFYLSAHDHNRQVIVRDGEPYYLISGGGGENVYSVAGLQKGLLYAEAKTGFAKLTLDARQMEIAYYGDDTNLAAKFSVQRACADTASACIKPLPLD